MVGSRASKPVPLHRIPAVEEPFSNIVVDVVGPLPRTKGGSKYLLTMMCRSNRYPDAIPVSVSSAASRNLIPSLMGVFSKFGVP